MSPTELIQHAIINGITVLGLTDHDTIKGWQEAKGAVRGGFKLALGAEISCFSEEHKSVHMLGLLFDEANGQMQQLLAESRDTRLPRMRAMVELLQLDGYDVSLDDVFAAAPDRATIGRPHLADALVAKGIVATRDDAFSELLHNDSKYYVTHAAPTPEQAISTIKSAGGVAVIAHPFASRRGQTLSSDSFEGLVAAGLDGIEVHHRDQNQDERSVLQSIAQELGLIVTGASDYHGTGKLNAIAENTTAPLEWEALESRANARRVIKV